MADITINFNGNPVTVKQNKEGLYRLNDVAYAALFNVENCPHKNNLQNTVRDRLNGYVRYLSEKQALRFEVTAYKGKYGGTYGNEKSVYWLAAKFDEDFEDAVFEAFKQAVNGEGAKAVDLAQMVARISGKEVRKYETDAIKAYQEYKGIYKTTKGRVMFGQVTNITNDVLGIEKGQRDFLSAQQLLNVSVADQIVATAFLNGVKEDAAYESVIEVIKHNLDSYFELTGFSLV